MKHTRVLYQLLGVERRWTPLPGSETMFVDRGGGKVDFGILCGREGEARK